MVREARVSAVQDSTASCVRGRAGSRQPAAGSPGAQVADPGTAPYTLRLLYHIDWRTDGRVSAGHGVAATRHPADHVSTNLL